jgi:hypothetical protein
MNRRDFVRVSVFGIPLLTDLPFGFCASSEKGFFTLSNKSGRWLFVTPDSKPFFSLGLNHIDHAGLRYEANRQIWEEKYENSMKKWLQTSVRPNLLSWGFNTVGWTREVVTKGLTNHRHSRHFTYEEYQWLNMPYCHQLPFADFHQWEAETIHPDFFNSDFEDWCDVVAREHCVPLANDPKLIGYFYLDCPTWVHTRPENTWKGPIFNPKDLETAAGRKELTRIARQYYKITQESIRRYDKNHLILGDRYDANEPLPDEVIFAALPLVDVLSFQDFQDPVGHLKYWHKKTKYPVLWADGAKKLRTEDPTKHRNNGNWYAEKISGLYQNRGCVGGHLCGAYIRNRARMRGIISENDEIDEEMVTLMKNVNQQIVAEVSQMEING